MSYGFVYVLVNESLPYLKVGKTRRSPEQRAVELSSTGVPTPFVVAYSRYVENCDKLESDIHRRLSSKRVNANREFFAEDLSFVVELIESLVSPTPPAEALPPDWDPISYIAMLGKDRGDTAQSKIDDIIYYRGLAQDFREQLLSILESVNGSIDANGLEIFFDAPGDDEGLSICINACLTELPRCATVPLLRWGTIHCVFEWSAHAPKSITICGDDNYKLELREGSLPDIRVIAKAILDKIEWPSLIEAEQRRGGW